MLWLDGKKVDKDRYERKYNMNDGDGDIITGNVHNICRICGVGFITTSLDSVNILCSYCIEALIDSIGEDKKGKIKKKSRQYRIEDRIERNL